MEAAVVMGSDSDWPVVQAAVDTLDGFGIGSDVRVISAHRTPDEAAAFAQGAAKQGFKVIIAAAGGAAHLGGVLAAHTTLPVIGIPVKGGALNGLDAVLATLQMPAGIPVATVTLGNAGPVNAAVLAAQILAVGRPALRRRLAAYKRELKKKVQKGNARVRREAARGRGDARDG
ncbi:MAG: 5-(carboxyamino)imidazole ribonucleotide mutase [Lentisphaerae bacterium]|nr:5-(carboxyamino)imidazole ribonucleotide mutase [Lentisphaerota bacterium]